VNNAIRKYGRNNVRIEKVLVLKCTQQYLDLIEDRAIIAFDTLAPKGYNLKRGGSHGKHNERSKAKMSLAKRGRPGTWIGRHHSEESRIKMSRAKMSAAKKRMWAERKKRK
jgi:hypothetical protein